MVNILFCGPVGASVGGGESGNKRTLSVLADLGHRVDVLCKPYPKRSSAKLLNAISYLGSMVLYFFRLLKILSVRSDIEYVHISGFYGHLIYVEALQIFMSKILRRKVVYELRAGGVIDFYKSGNFFYKYLFSRAIKSADYVLSQGEVNLSFILQEFDVHAIYYPNYVHGSYICSEESIASRATIEHVNLVFLGRIVPEKGIDFVVSIFNDVAVGFDHASLYLVGPVDDVYKANILKLANDFGISNRVIFVGVLQPKEIGDLLEKMHFYIFPTKEPREGHSNSLTEAMAKGVVPIVSDAGFNRQVVGSDFYVVDKYDAEGYSKIIKQLLDSRVWLEHSRLMKNRVKALYINDVAAKTLGKVYRRKT